MQNKCDITNAAVVNRISLYPLAHLSVIHLSLNAFSLFGPLTMFERTHGTVHTAIMLNLLAVSTAILYCLIGSLLFPNVDVAGSSGWCFSLFAYYSVKESVLRPSQRIVSTYSFPTIYIPVVLLLLITIIVPGSSFWGHFLGMIMGYVLAFKESIFCKLAPPSSLVIKIETKLDRLINLIPLGVKYYREQEADRSLEYASIFHSEDVLPIHNNENFQGQGRALGA